MFSRILIVNVTLKLYRISSYLFLFPCTATQEAERKQEECQMAKELFSEGILQGKESRKSIYFFRVLRLCARWRRGSYVLRQLGRCVFRINICDHQRNLPASTDVEIN